MSEKITGLIKFESLRRDNFPPLSSLRSANVQHACQSKEIVLLNKRETWVKIVLLKIAAVTNIIFISIKTLRSFINN